MNAYTFQLFLSETLLIRSKRLKNRAKRLKNVSFRFDDAKASARESRPHWGRMGSQLKTPETTKIPPYPAQFIGSSLCGAGIFVFWSFQIYPSRPHPPAMRAAFARRLRVDPSATFSRLI